MQETVLKGTVAIASGVFTIVCAAADFEFFMGHRKAQFFVKLLGRDGARFFYAVLGLALCVLGLFIMR